ncbi:uracil phosphoribosyltransferase [Candidatus Woesearchaeota archaeon]|nr:uracil phosphoribosyltransferase [Candidatus Woesearchaeota archaeon]
MDYFEEGSGVFVHPTLEQVVAQMRNRRLQQSSALFRRNTQTVGKELAAKVRQDLFQQSTPEGLRIREVVGHGGTADYRQLKGNVGILCILRAGLSMTYGVQEVFEEAPVAFVDAKRIEDTYDGKGAIGVKLNYVNVPPALRDLTGTTLLIPDPMLATGCSLVTTCQSLFELYGTPKETIALSVIATTQGIERFLGSVPRSKVYTAVIDQKLDGRGYIVPGLGDAGDLSFGGGVNLLDTNT